MRQTRYFRRDRTIEPHRLSLPRKSSEARLAGRPHRTRSQPCPVTPATDSPSRNQCVEDPKDRAQLCGEPGFVTDLPMRCRFRRLAPVHTAARHRPHPAVGMTRRDEAGEQQPTRLIPTHDVRRRPTPANIHHLRMRSARRPEVPQNAGTTAPGARVRSDESPSSDGRKAEFDDHFVPPVAQRDRSSADRAKVDDLFVEWCGDGPARGLRDVLLDEEGA